jgi:hypothetical protein
MKQIEMWQTYLQRIEEAGASREPGAAFTARPKSK